MSEKTSADSVRSPFVSNLQLVVLTILRMAIGWHFLYEGVVKLTSGWTSAPYLETSRWIFAEHFQWIASNPTALAIADLLNIWGLILIGLGLMLGCLTRIAAVGGVLLLVLYYVAQPPIPGLGFDPPKEGTYLFVTKNVIEFFGLVVVALFRPSAFLGLDGIIARRRRLRKAAPVPSVSSASGAVEPSPEVAAVPVGRREVLKNLAGLPVLGAFVIAYLKRHGWESFEEKNLEDRQKVDAVTSATIKKFRFTELKELTGKIPHAPIKNKQFSRLILGGNLIGGWAHSRDLIYVSKLVKAYHSDEKVFETFYLAEKCGINAILTNPILCRVINAYWDRRIGNIQFISDCGGKDLLKTVQKSIDHGASACYVQGGTADRLVKGGEIKVIGEALDLIRKHNLPAGIGGHRIETIKACVEYGYDPDFWMKTFHHTNYWSAKAESEHDNIYCRKPEETTEFMKNLPQPWIAFKTLAAGAIHPKDRKVRDENVEGGFRYAFRNGADFICVGMYDFQLVEDANIALDILGSKIDRERRWWPPEEKAVAAG